VIYVLRSELSNLRMTTGNEKEYNRVVDGVLLKEWVGIGWITIRVVDGVLLKEWVGIGWITIRTATEQDRKVYPIAVDKMPDEVKPC